MLTINHHTRVWRLTPEIAKLGGANGQARLNINVKNKEYNVNIMLLSLQCMC